MTTASIGVVVADDDPLSRSSLVAVLARQHDLLLVGEAATGTEAVTAAAALHPDVVVMDVRMPGMDGVEATRAITAGASTDSRVLILTAFQDDSTIDSLAAGASGFLLKRSYRDLPEAVRQVAAGEGWIDPAVAGEVLAALRVPGGRRSRHTVRSRLTPRETEVAALMAGGLYNEEIAARLGLALPTVKTHVTRVRTKTGSRNRVEAVVAVIRAGIVCL